MNTKLPLLLVCIMATMCVFAQRETKRSFDRENLRERRMQSETFSFRERTKPEMRNNRNSVSTRQSNVAKHRLDSVVLVGYLWNSKDKVEFEYDSNGNMTVGIDTYWDSWDDVWRKFRKVESTYDSNGNLTRWIEYRWINNVWRESSKIEYVYASNGNMITKTEYYWTLWEGWVRLGRTNYVYDNQGNLTMELRYTWNNNAWREFSKFDFLYDNNGNLTRQTYYFHNSDNNTWRESSKIEFSYDNNGNLTMWTSYEWRSMWIEHWKAEFVHENNRNMITATYSRWEGNTWRSVWKDEEVYDSNGNLTMMIEYNWRNNVWEEYWKTKFEFDLFIPIDNVLLSNVFVSDIMDFENIESVFFNKIVNRKEYEWWNNTWYESSTLTFHYSQVPTNIPNISTSSLSIFPNPVFENFTINGVTEDTLVKITDLNGRIVLQRIVAANEQISISHLPAGVYFVRVNGETAKIVKR